MKPTLSAYPVVKRKVVESTITNNTHKVYLSLYKAALYVVKGESVGITVKEMEKYTQ